MEVRYQILSRNTCQRAILLSGVCRQQIQLSASEREDGVPACFVSTSNSKTNQQPYQTDHVSNTTLPSPHAARKKIRRLPILTLLLNGFFYLTESFEGRLLHLCVRRRSLGDRCLPKRLKQLYGPTKLSTIQKHTSLMISRGPQLLLGQV